MIDNEITSVLSLSTYLIRITLQINFVVDGAVVKVSPHQIF